MIEFSYPILLISSIQNCKFFPIPKVNIENFRPIALFSVFCKIVEVILKNGLDLWLESNQILSGCMYGFGRGLGTIDGLSTVASHIYYAFYKRQYLTTVFLDIKSAYDSVNISILIFCMFSLKIFYYNDGLNRWLRRSQL